MGLEKKCFRCAYRKHKSCWGGGSTIAYANGSTDYFEVYFYHNFGVATSDIDTAISSTFSGTLSWKWLSV